MKTVRQISIIAHKAHATDEGRAFLHTGTIREAYLQISLSPLLSLECSIQPRYGASSAGTPELVYFLFVILRYFTLERNNSVMIFLYQYIFGIQV